MQSNILNIQLESSSNLFFNFPIGPSHVSSPRSVCPLDLHFHAVLRENVRTASSNSFNAVQKSEWPFANTKKFMSWNIPSSRIVSKEKTSRFILETIASKF